MALPVVDIKPSARARFQRDMIRRMNTLERSYAKQLNRVLNRQYLDAAKSIQSGDTSITPVINKQTARLTSVINKQTARLTSDLEAHYRRVANIFGLEALNTIMGKADPQRIETKAVQDDFWQAMFRFIGRQVGVKIVGIQKTTRNRIRNVIEQGIADSLELTQIASNIRVAGKFQNPARALTIARTETHGAAVNSIDMAMDQTGIEMEREWVATIDDRTREKHISADGQRRPKNEPFDVGGESLMYPGDPAGSAGNVINCRCVLLYHVPDEF